MPATEHVRKKLSQVPHRPGVYLHKDRFGTVIYVGKARDLRKRVSQYFHPSRRLGWDLKFQALVEAIQDLDWHVVRSEAEALLLEGKLIKEFKPRFNIDFRDDKRFLLLKVHLQDAIPRFTLTRIQKEDGAIYFGPFAHSGALRRTLTILRRRFHLRGCRALTPGPADHKHCLYANLKNCTAPCIGSVTREEYLSQIEAACEFLRGRSDEMRLELEHEMLQASARQEYEKAAQLRDAITDLGRTTEQTKRFDRIPYTLPVATRTAADLEELGRVLELRTPPARIEGFDISNISGTFMVASMVSFWQGRPHRAGYRRFKMKTVTSQNDFACMAETVRRRYARVLKEIKSIEQPGLEGEGFEASPMELRDRSATTYGLVDPGIDAGNTLPIPMLDDGKLEEAEKGGRKKGEHRKEKVGGKLPDLIVIDGGKGQLNAAVYELQRLGLAHIPILGLAKEFEEIHLPYQTEPLRLSLESGALKLLQRVRDESHRFANTYNAQLRLRKISESVLDEFPGIGTARKQTLLKTFGSVQRLREASVEQIAAIPGFGARTAEALKTFLDARI
jgi:excinuclease ABC subunit C